MPSYWLLDEAAQNQSEGRGQGISLEQGQDIQSQED